MKEYMREIQRYRWYNEDVEREKRALRDEAVSKAFGIPLWDESEFLFEERQETVEIKSLWHAVKILWSL